MLNHIVLDELKLLTSKNY